ncbi:multiple monosaccharide ABC transporter substrate-binding protein [Paractinoplanes atraurantiacus]|uniref:Putative multiple sugar transport system substrate-binding protein n=1 Tax=Paractinoplanes atraurantiacus TaxID=1036182 RepID=A0A285KBE1_9ACTN|nr:multiple monosaccharide ABC transporter substrate-binding protein [Actinoplanes atraurantiacus]SNY68756.1 putative multiple sugar transport system substrate-binding protein [Actinoplanes atraurantiacus]
MFRRCAALIAAVLLAGVSGCAGDDIDAVAAPDPGTIGIALPTKDSARWIADGDNMVKQFEALGYKADLQYADNDVGTQQDQLDAMIAAGDRALVIGSIDGTQLKSQLQDAHDKGIPVISYDRLIRESANVDYYASFDNFKVGVLQGRTIANHLNLAKAKRPYRMELFAGSADDNNARFFFNGAMSVLNPYLKNGTLKVPSGQTQFAKVTTQQWDGKVAAARMEKLIKANDATLDAVLSPYDGISRGIIETLQKYKKKVPVVTGQDAELDSVKLINQGVQTETVYKDTRELAKVTVQMTDKVLSGETPDINDTKTYANGVKVVPAFLLQPVSVEKANLKTVLIDGGYYKESDLA